VPVTAEEYRKKQTKVIKLESGDEWKIRKLPVDAMSGFLEAMGIEIQPGMTMKAIEKHVDEVSKSPEFRKKMFDAMQIVIPSGTVEPKVVTVNKAPKGALSISEIAAIDQFELFMEIVKFQSLPEKAKSFPARTDS